MTVIMQGLVGRADLNGQNARVLGLQGERYQIEVLASGETVAIKEQNLAPVQVAPVEGLPHLVPVPKPGPALLKQDEAVLSDPRLELKSLKIRTQNTSVSKTVLDHLPAAKDTQAELRALDVLLAAREGMPDTIEAARDLANRGRGRGERQCGRVISPSSRTTS